MTAGGARGRVGAPGGTPPLVGLVLAGGLSRRMGRDKGSLAFRGSPLVELAMTALRPFAQSVQVSVRRQQVERDPYRGRPLLIDSDDVVGPAAGLLAAWAAHPAAALLVLAVDMPLVDAATLGHLVAHRSVEHVATAYRHADRTPEPLCAIWEPSARAAFRMAAAPGVPLEGDASPAAPSLRRILESADVSWLDAPDPTRLVSLNTPEALAAAESQESNSSR